MTSRRGQTYNPTQPDSGPGPKVAPMPWDQVKGVRYSLLLNLLSRIYDLDSDFVKLLESGSQYMI